MKDADLPWLGSAGVAYGCMNVCGAWNRPRDNPHEPILAAFEAGIRVFDHADIYAGGRCEEAYAAAARAEPALLREGRVVTKFGHVFPPGGGFHRYDTTPGHLRSSVEGSLRRLSVEKIDLLLIHRPDPLMDLDALAGVAAELREAGHVAAFGVSNFSPAQTAAARAAGWGVAANQVECSALHHGPLLDGSFDDCLTHGTVPMAWASLARGQLTGAPLPGDDGGPAADPAERERVTATREALAETGLPPARAALAWVRTHPAGPVPVVGTTRPEKIREAAEGAGDRLDRLAWYRVFSAAGGSLP